MSKTSYSKMDDHGRPVRALSKEEQKTQRISKKIDGVKTTMHSNIAAATARGAQLKDLEDSTEELEERGSSFLKTSSDVKKMFQWKAFLWQLAFAGIILLVLSAVTLWILSETGVLNNQGRSSPPAPAAVPLVASPPPLEAAVDPTTTALFTVKPGTMLLKSKLKLIAAGEKCTLGGISAVVAEGCAEGLTCVADPESKEGVCRPPEKLATESKPENTEACPKGEVACTAELVAGGNECIIGRCIIQATTGSDATVVKSDEPKPSPPLTAGARVYISNGEDPTKTEAEILEALVTLHRHGADCSVGILHTDCTLDLMMKSWGVWS